MARPLRIEYPDAWYHVMNRGRNRYPIFSDKEDFQTFLNVTKDACKLFNGFVISYCLMKNHYHLLINTPEGNLSRIMRHINGIYTQKYNRRHKKDGTLFKGRYKSILIEEDVYLKQIVRYIHLNPVKAKIKDEFKYKWSSHLNYVKGENDGEWLDVLRGLNFFSGNKKKAIEEYKAFIDRGIDKETEKFYSGKIQGPIFGEESFIEEIKKRFIYDEEKPDFEIKEKRKATGDKIVEIIKDEVCNIFKCDQSSLYSSTRGESNVPRSMAILISRELSGLTLPEISQIYKVKSYKTASAYVYRMKERMKSNSKLIKQYNKIVKRCGQVEI